MRLDDMAPRMAEILTHVCQPVEKGEYVGIIAPSAAEPLIVALYEAVLRRGGHALVMPQLAQLDEIFYEVASDEQLDFLDPVQMFVIDTLDKVFFISAPTNPKALSQVAASRTQRHLQARRPFIQRYFERIDDPSFGWNISAWPTEGAAQQAGTGLRAYTEFVYRACGLDQTDPVAYWREFDTRQQRLVEWLRDKQRLEVRGPGIELTMSVQDRLWINSWGEHNFPSGEIFTSPLEESVDGYVEFSYPSLYGGREVDGVKLKFREGVVVAASAGKGEDYLLSQLDTDEGARRLGEFAIGTNYGIQQVTGSTLFDEKIGGTIHMALGQGFKEANGVNQSAIHWDLVHEMKQGGAIWADGTLFYQNGQFVVEV